MADVRLTVDVRKRGRQHTPNREDKHKRPEEVARPDDTVSAGDDSAGGGDWREAWLLNEGECGRLSLFVIGVVLTLWGGAARTGVCDWSFDERLRFVTPRMRSVLFDWLFEVTLEYRLSHKTLQLATLYVDRCLCALPELPRGALQLLGVAAMLVASKFEDVCPVDVASLVWISDEACTPDQVGATEKLLLETLEWDVACVTAVGWVEAFVAATELEPCEQALLGHMATYLSHLMAQHWPTSQRLLPSQQAACAVYYAGMAQNLLKTWPHAAFAGVETVAPDHPDVVHGLRALHLLYRALPALDMHRALRSKYSHFSVSSVALTPPLAQAAAAHFMTGQ